MNTSTTDKSRFNELIHASPIAMVIYHTREMVITAINEEMLAIWGKDESVIGKTFAAALPEMDGQPFLGLLQQVYDTGVKHHSRQDPAHIEIDGQLQTSYFNFTYKAIKAADGTTEAVIHTAIDVTELVFASHKMVQAEERLSFSLESAELGTWDLNPKLQTVQWDERCQELFGFEGDNFVLYERVLECIHPDDKQRVMEAVKAAIDPQEPVNYDIRYRTIGKQSPKEKWVHCKGRAYFDANGEAYRFVGTAKDITKEVNTHLNEQQLFSLVNDNADHMSIADMEGRLIYMNNAGRLLLGVTEEEDITQLTSADFYDKEEHDKIERIVNYEICPEKGWQGTVYMRNKVTHEQIPCQVNYILIKNTYTGTIIGRGATARDLRAELKAKVELQRLATIVDISEDFCNYTDMLGNTLYINEAGSKLIGISGGDFSKANIYAYHSPSSSALIATAIMEQLLKNGKWSGSLELKHLGTGEIIPIHKQLFIIYDELTKKPIAIAGIARDLRSEINAQKAMDKKNAELEQALREMEFLANAVPAVVWTSKANGELDFINERWYECSDTPISEALGTGWTGSMHADDVQKVLRAWKQSLATGEPYQVEFRLKDKFGKYRWWLVRALALTDYDGQIVKWYGTNTDITEQKDLERQKDNFLGVASHELKTPVTSIKAYAQVLEMMLKRAGDTKNAALMSKMDRQINRLTSLIGDLLDVTKINSGRLQFHNAPFDFNQLMVEVIEEIQFTTEKHQIKSELSFLGMITGDRDRISQVIVNLLTNAIKYSPDANRIIVYSEDHGHEVQLCVQDFGIGLSRDKQDRVFEQFYRVSGTKQHTFPGLGLGLYISSEIIKQLGGRIWVNSIYGKGSTFCFALPKERPKDNTISI